MTDKTERWPDSTKELAVFIHETYGKIEREKVVCPTQASHYVEFDDLPIENQTLLLGIAEAIDRLHRFSK